jgi:hypothetical protein
MAALSGQKSLSVPAEGARRSGISLGNFPISPRGGNALAIFLILLLALVVSIFGLVNTLVMYLFVLLAVPSLSLEAKCADWAKIAPWPLNVLSRVLSRALLWFMGILFGLVMLLNLIF